MMRTREEVARFIEAQMDDDSAAICVAKDSRVHYGLVELRWLMDFLYDGEPQTDEEKLGRQDRPTKWR